MNNRSYKSIDERQSYVTKSGKAWEDMVMEIVNKGLKNKNSELKVIKGNTINKGSPLWSKLAIPVGEKSSGKKIWGDLDLVVVSSNFNPVGIISCKTSLHGRFSETLFYAVIWKNLIPNIKIVFASPDKGRQSKSRVWQSEWGSENKPTKDRLLGSWYLDGIYILNEKTIMGGIIKPLEDLPKDLIKWRKTHNNTS